MNRLEPDCRECDLYMKFLDWLARKLLRFVLAQKKLRKKRTQKGHICKDAKLCFVPALALQLFILGFNVPVAILIGFKDPEQHRKLVLIRGGKSLE